MLINIIVVIIDNHNRIIADNTSSSISNVDPWDLEQGSRSSLFLAENLVEREEKRQASPGHHHCISLILCRDNQLERGQASPGDHCDFFLFCAWIINWKKAQRHLVAGIVMAFNHFLQMEAIYIFLSGRYFGKFTWVKYLTFSMSE